MKNIILFRTLALCIFTYISACQLSFGQNFVQITNASGYDYNSIALSEINKQSDRLSNVFASSGGYEVKVFAFSSYSHAASSIAGINESLLCARQTANGAGYNLLIGSIYNSEGYFDRFDISFSLPNEGPFACFGQRETEFRNILQKRAAEATKSQDLAPSPELIIKDAADYFTLLKNCPACASGNGDICFKSSFDGIDMKLKGLGFRKISVSVAGNEDWPMGQYGIYDHVKKKINVDGGSYHIPDQIYESKLALENGITIVNDDTTFTVNGGLNGHAYILNNLSFLNGTWDAMQAQASGLDFVECWVLLKDTDEQYYLYSRFSFGPFTAPSNSNGGAVKEIDKGSRIAVSPLGLALKAIGNAAINVCMEATINRLTDEKINDWEAAFKSVDYLGATWEGVSSLLPWKKTKTTAVVQAIIQGFVVVVNKAITTSGYTANLAFNDFIAAVGSSLMTQWLGPKVTGAASKFTSGILRLGQSTNNGTVKKISRKFAEFTCFIKGGCFAESTFIMVDEKSKKIPDIKIGEYVKSSISVPSYNKFVTNTKHDVTSNVDYTWYDFFEIDSNTWSTARFEVRSFDNDIIEINITRPNEWFIDRNANNINDSCFFQLPEFGVFGYGKMVSNKERFNVDCNVKKTDSAFPVITTFKRYSENIFNVYFENLDSLVVTDNHLLFSKTRNDYIPVSQLLIGETVLTSGDKEVKFIGLQKRLKGEFVYNIEVYRSHNYFVSSNKLENFILAHNSCADGITDNALAQKASKEFGEAFEEVLDEAVNKAVKAPKKLSWPELLALFKRGNDFNAKARLKYTLNEINLLDKKRLDSYIPGQKIISRKATDIDKISEDTWHKYCNELVTKYKVGKAINSTKPGVGSTLSGKYYLEIPSTNQSASKLQSFRDIAATYGKENGGITIIFLAE